MLYGLNIKNYGRISYEKDSAKKDVENGRSFYGDGDVYCVVVCYRNGGSIISGF